MLVKHRTDGQFYAMKILRKENIVKRNQVEHTKTERSVLEIISHPFIVNLFYAFQTPKKLYMVLEYCGGGEIFFHLSRLGRFSEPKCRFYSSEIMTALEHLHGKSIIYRDMKPENLLLDTEGHVKVTDFGLSKEGIMDNISARTLCGTPEYLAPEILDKKGHGKAVDWYSLGALIYEMLTGLPPFYTRDRDKLFDRIRRGDLSYPPYIRPEAKSLLQGLLCRDPEVRLGGGPEDGAAIRGHAFFEEINFDDVVNRRLEPPFVPTLAHVGDTKYFDKQFVDLQAVDSSFPTSQDASENNPHFDGFTYTKPTSTK